MIKITSYIEMKLKSMNDFFKISNIKRTNCTKILTLVTELYKLKKKKKENGELVKEGHAELPRIKVY